MNLMELFIKIFVDDQASSKVGSISNKLGKGLKAASKVGIAAVGATSAALIKLAKDSISAYAEFEQLEGGVKKLFGDHDMKTVIANADKAYKTAGMSANKYLETTTSFAASLIAGLDGDTEKAAKYADMAIRDMSDNANTFGTDISMIQNAYQGFAKQNYTMLDNLKLGYGGTASEMARLINDSGVLGDTVTVTASNINRVSFDKIVEAINVMQTQMGIAETTVNEAGTTIEGSINTMKGAWENLMTAMVSDTGDVEQRLDEFIESVGTVGENLLPIIDTGLDGIVTLVRELAPKIIDELPGLVETLAPKALESAMGIVGALSDSLLNGGAEQLLDVGLDMLFMLLDAIVNGLTDEQAVQKLTQLIVNMALKLTEPDTLVPLVNSAGDILTALAGGLIDSVFILIGAIPKLIDNLADSIINMGTSEEDTLFDAGLEIVTKIFEGLENIDLKEIVKSLVNLIVSLFSNYYESLKDIGTNIFDSIKNGFENGDIGSLVEGFANKLIENFRKHSVLGWILDEIGVFDEETDGKRAGRSSGLYYVPHNDYLTRLHEGEMVLRRGDAERYRNGIGSHSGSTINIKVNGAQYNSEESLAEAIAYRIQQMANQRGAAYA